MQQPDLFTWTPKHYPHVPAYRPTDTSKAAAESMKRSAGYIRNKVMQELTIIGEEGATSLKLSELLKMPYESVQPRLSELKNRGLVRDSGKRGESRAKDKTAIVWVKIEGLEKSL